MFRRFPSMIVLAAALFAWLAPVPAASQPVQAWQDDGWPGGEAAMICTNVQMQTRLTGRARNATYRFDLGGDRVSGRIGDLFLKFETLSTRLHPTGFEADRDLESTRGVIRVNYSADFRNGALTITVYYSRAYNSRINSKTFPCEVLYAPFPDEDPDEVVDFHTDMLARMRRIAAGHAPGTEGEAPAAELLAQSTLGLRDAVEAALDAAKGQGNASLGDLPYFRDSKAGRDYARSPRGRAIATGRPRNKCAAFGTSRATLPYGAVEAAYAACVAALDIPPVNADCACAADAVGAVLLSGAEAFVYAAQPRAVVATAAADGSGIIAAPATLDGDPDDARGVRIRDAEGREMCSGVQIGADPPRDAPEARCVRFGARYRISTAHQGLRGMRPFGVLLGVDENKAELSPRRLLLVFFNFDDAALDRITAELPELWNE